MSCTSEVPMEQLIWSILEIWPLKWDRNYLKSWSSHWKDPLKKYILQCQETSQISSKHSKRLLINRKKASLLRKKTLFTSQEEGLQIGSNSKVIIMGHRLALTLIASLLVATLVKVRKRLECMGWLKMVMGGNLWDQVIHKHWVF